MIELSTGAVLDKEFSMRDFVDGRIYHTRGWLSTFHPCRLCITGCRRQTYTQCDKEYLERWLEWRGEQSNLDMWTRIEPSVKKLRRCEKMTTKTEEEE